MSVLFHSIYNEGNWAAWPFSDVTRAAPFPSGYGIGGGPSNTCNGGSDSALTWGNLGNNYLPAPVAPPPWGYHALTFKFQYAINASISINDGLNIILTVSDLLPISGVGFGNSDYMFASQLTINANGSLGLYIADGLAGAGFNFTSAPGVVPINGTIHGYQVAYNISPTSVSYAVLVDNVSVFSGTQAIAGHCGSGYGYMTNFAQTCPFFVAQAAIVGWAIFHRSKPASTSPRTILTNWAEFIVEDTGTTGSYPAAAVAPIALTICAGTPPVVAVTVLAVDCVTNQLTITGTNFLAGYTVTLTGPGGAIAFTTVSTTATTIVLQLTNPWVDGTYCATVGVSNTLCTALTCGPVATITHLAIDCPANQLTITGTLFAAGDTITLTGPGGAIAFILKDLIATQIVLQLIDPLVNGTYCVTVGRSAQFCQALACATPGGPPGCLTPDEADVTGAAGCATLF